MKDRLFDATHCERCGLDLTKSARIMSWFTEETICMKCSSGEGAIKQKLHDSGQGSMEGCGYIPTIN